LASEFAKPSSRHSRHYMMCSFWSVFACWSFAWVKVLALRMEMSEHASVQTGAWQRKTYMFCLNEVAEIKCDGPDQMMQVSSAFYNRNTKTDGTECGPHESEWKSCAVNANEMVSRQCDNTNICHLLPSEHATCEEEAFQQMRVVVKCRTAGKGDAIRTEPPRPGLEDIPTTTASSEETQADLQGDPQPMIVKEMNDGHLEQVEFVPCYRSLTVQHTLGGDVHSDTWQAELSSSVTNCGPQEGCFHLNFPDGKAYSDENQPPAPEELVKGELAETGEHMWKTYNGVGLRQVDYGIGLKRNDYATWGICLPKTETLQYAVALWDAMKKSFKKKS